MSRPGLFLLVLVLLVGALALATAWRASARKADALRAFPPLDGFVQVDGHPVHYRQMGAGPDLVLLHGASGNIRDLTFDLAPALADRYRVTLFDRPGLGHTPPLAPRGVTLQDQARLLSGAAQALGVTDPVVVGHSFGGAVAMAWAVHFPDRLSGLVSLAGASHPWPGDHDRLNLTLAHPLAGPVVSTLASAWVPQAYVRQQIAATFAPEAMPEGYAAQLGAPLTLQPHALRANAQQRIDLRPELRSLAPRYDTLELPIEILHGDADSIVGLDIHARALAADAPGARLKVLAGVGHMLQHTALPQVIAAIDRAAHRAALH